MRKFSIEHLRQCFGMPFVDREYDGFADQWFAQLALVIDEAVVQHLPEFTHDGAISLGNGEATLQRGGVYKY